VGKHRGAVRPQVQHVHHAVAGAGGGAARPHSQYGHHHQGHDQPAEVVPQWHVGHSGQSPERAAPGPVALGHHLRVEEEVPRRQRPRRHRDARGDGPHQHPGRQPGRPRHPGPGQRDHPRHAQYPRPQRGTVGVTAERYTRRHSQRLDREPAGGRHRDQGGRGARTARRGGMPDAEGEPEHDDDHDERRAHAAFDQRVPDLHQHQRREQDPHEGGALSGNCRPRTANGRSSPGK
jgi:hypothetical protein